jgi:uncharacterized protein YecA (UPF0149 family)
VSTTASAAVGKLWFPAGRAPSAAAKRATATNAQGRVSAEMREKLIAGAAASVPAIHRYFAAKRLSEAQRLSSVGTFRRDAPKIDRNEPCPCGSGKKFKRCCANITLH